MMYAVCCVDDAYDMMCRVRDDVCDVWCSCRVLYVVRYVVCVVLLTCCMRVVVCAMCMIGEVRVFRVVCCVWFVRVVCVVLYVVMLV